VGYCVTSSFISNLDAHKSVWNGPKGQFGKKWVIAAVILDVPKAFDTLWVKGLHSPSNHMHPSFDAWGLKKFRVDLSPGPLCR
jgi:hypothetical protein